jgi:hypothetical protein
LIADPDADSEPDSPLTDEDPPGPLPEPPLDLVTRQLPIREWVDREWFRGHRLNYHPIYFNRRDGRFAAPRREFGTLYLGIDAACAFLEAFGKDLLWHDGRYTVGMSVLAGRCLCVVRAQGTIRLVDLTKGEHLLRLSADSRIADGPHRISRRWALALWSHPEVPHGLLYRSRRLPDRFCVALFDRAASRLSARHPAGALNLLADRHQLASLLDTFQCELIP